MLKLNSCLPGLKAWAIKAGAIKPGAIPDKELDRK